MAKNETRFKQKKPSKEIIVSLDKLRETHVTSHLKRFVYAQLPHDDVLKLMQIKHYTIQTTEEAKQVDDLKHEVLQMVPNGTNVSWEDKNKFATNFRKGTGFDFDLYIRFGKPIKASANTMTVRALLGAAGENITLIQSKQSVEQFRDTRIKDKTSLWIEVCTDPLLARHKLYQLFRAWMVLKPSKDEKIIGIICLNGQWENAQAVAQVLRQNSFVRKRATDNHMELAVVWTNQRNLYTSMMRVEKGLSELKGILSEFKENQAELKENQAELKVNQAEMKENQGAMKENQEKCHTKLEKMEKKLNKVEQMLDELLRRLPQQAAKTRSITTIAIAITTMVTILFLLREII